MLDVEAIIRLAGSGDEFSVGTQRIHQWVDGLSRADIAELLLVVGNIPEMLKTNGREEKLYAYLVEAVATRSFQELGFDAAMSGARGDAADLVGEGGGVRFVVDAKAFRMSRTAINQKDFKVESVHQWRRGAGCAVILAPSNRYPGRASQIYAQSARYNVALLTYWHLAYWLEVNATPATVAKALSVAGHPTGQAAPRYWKATTQTVTAYGDDGVMDAIAARGRAACAAFCDAQIRYCAEQDAALELLDRTALLSICRASLGYAAKEEAIRAMRAELVA